MRMRPLTSGAVLAVVMALAGAPSARAADADLQPGRAARVPHRDGPRGLEARCARTSAPTSTTRRTSRWTARSCSRWACARAARARASGDKPGLLIDTNKYVSNQEFHGLKKLVLDNVIQDASFLHEPLAYQVFEAMGIASPGDLLHAPHRQRRVLGRVLADGEHRQELPGRALRR